MWDSGPGTHLFDKEVQETLKARWTLMILGKMFKGERGKVV
jgi:hypothetical protein